MRKSKFSTEQKLALQELVGLPPRLSRDSTPAKTSVPLADVCRILDLPEPGFRELLTKDRWLIGGAVARWLYRNPGKGQVSQGDYDLFFRTLDDFNRTGRRLLTEGFTFRCFWTFRTICQLCGRPGQLVRKDEVDDLTYPLPRVRCLDCGDFGGFDAASLTPDRLMQVTPELVATSRMRVLELTSPNQDIFHLVAVTMGSTPGEVMDQFDLSPSQFGIDDENLYFAPFAWTDVLLGRLRVLQLATPGLTFKRFKKYSALGFRPYPESFVRMYLCMLRRDWWNQVVDSEWQGRDVTG